MKKQKKLLLTAISAMAVAAIGTGAVSTFAWYTATASASTYANTVNASITTAQTNASLDGVLFTVARTSADADLEGEQLTDNSGKTAYYLDSTLHGNIAPSKGYTTVVYSVTASKQGSSGDLSLAQLLTNIYNSGTTSVYLRVTAGSQARVATSLGTNDANVYVAGAEGATVTVACELSSTGATTTWTGLTVYASIKANTTEEDFSSAATLYSNATLSATVGSTTVAFDAVS